MLKINIKEWQIPIDSYARHELDFIQKVELM